MKVVSAEFVTSAALRPAPAEREGLAQGRTAGGIAGIPDDGLPQIAMTGRSNVGKSTLLNALCRQKVARTSAAPGKTRLANIYRVRVDGGGSGSWSLYLVDLPGYGYARGGADAAAELRAVAEAYFAFAGRDVAGRGSAGRGFSPADPSTGEIDAPDARLTPRAAAVGALLLVDARHPGLASDVQAAQWLAAMGVAHRVVATKIDKLSRSERARNLKALETGFGMSPLAVSAVSGEGMDTLWKTIASLARTGRV